ncbi:MAG: ABC transporter permease subunit [Actinomycetota bacterium]|nr:ABC transporter permease subunit [Actinomycetota bacterium]
MTVGTVVGRAPGVLPAGRYGMPGLVRSEWLKLRTVRSTTWSLVLLVVLSVGIGALGTAETRAHWTASTAVGFDPTQTSLIGVFFAQLVIGVLGVLAMSAEYGTGTIRATFAAAPRRPLVLAAKSAVFFAVALVVSEVVAFVSFLLGQALLGAPAIHATLSSPGALRAVVESGLYLALLGLLGLGLATIIRHTAGAIGAFVGVVLVLPLVVQALPSSTQLAVRRWLPSRIGQSIIATRPSFGHELSPWVGFAVLCAYVAVVLVAGAVLLVRRDA